jgi:hypothetical protein
MYPNVIQFETKNRLALEEIRVRLIRRRTRSRRHGRFEGPWPRLASSRELAGERFLESAA